MGCSDGDQPSEALSKPLPSPIQRTLHTTVTFGGCLPDRVIALRCAQSKRTHAVILSTPTSVKLGL
jgi:hypothetical protein